MILIKDCLKELREEFQNEENINELIAFAEERFNKKSNSLNHYLKSLDDDKLHLLYQNVINTPKFNDLFIECYVLEENDNIISCSLDETIVINKMKKVMTAKNLTNQYTINYKTITKQIFNLFKEKRFYAKF